VIQLKTALFAFGLDPKKGTVTQIQVAMKDAKGPGIKIKEGLFLLSLEASAPAAGLVLKGTRKLGLREYLELPYLQIPVIGDQLSTLINMLPNGGGLAEGDIDVVIAPTPLSIGDVSVKEPTFRLSVKTSGLGIGAGLKSEIKGDFGKLIKGDINALRGKGSIQFSLKSLNEEVRKYASHIPVFGHVVEQSMNQFHFNYVKAGVELGVNSVSPHGELDFNIFSKHVNTVVAFDTVTDPTKLVPYLFNVIVNVTNVAIGSVVGLLSVQT